ncbi:MAG: UDP-N-acetylmuramoyl-L-alanine--D-glutamate ligase [Nitrospirota bacterium]
MEIRDKKVTVVGLGKSGIGAANLLSEIGAEVTVTDSKTEDGLKDFIARLNPSVRLALGGHPEDLFVSADMLVVSPGVPLDILPISKAKGKRIPIIGEIELAYQIMRNPTLNQVQGEIRNSKFLAITGTNGKSTTTTLLNLILRKGGFRTIIGGNIGSALTEEILKLVKSQESIVSSQKTLDSPASLRKAGQARPSTLDYIVAEVSSFQLESIRDFRPKVAAILNVTPDHLDRYHSLEEYIDAKARIFENQREDDFLVLNADDPATMEVESEKLKVKNERPRVLYFSRKQEIEGVYCKNGMIHCNLPFALCTVPLMSADEIKIKGVHNLENAMAASAIALLADCPLDAVIDSLREFHGLEHRLEFVREINGVRYFNDSKGTNVGAVTKSLESFTEPIILIAGGRDKSGDFSPLRDLVKEKVKALVFIGEAGEKIKRSLGDLTETVMAKDLKESVNISRNMAVKGDVILLSPACASFDMFLDFEDRGKQFKKIVMEMT